MPSFFRSEWANLAENPGEVNSTPAWPFMVSYDEKSVSTVSKLTKIPVIFPELWAVESVRVLFLHADARTDRPGSVLRWKDVCTSESSTGSCAQATPEYFSGPPLGSGDG